MTLRHQTRHFVTHNELELDLSFDPDNEPVIKETEDRIIVGYLCQDEDAENPCKHCDGMGQIRSLSNRHIDSIGIDEAEELIESNPFVVPLSYFEHGQSLWDVHGGERIGCCPDMRWDGVRFAGVWVPDECCMDEINLKKTDEEKASRAREMAEQCCKTYTSWCNGDCWGVCVDVFDKEWNKVEDDACWGHIGSEWAEQALKEKMGHYEKKETK